MGHDPQSEEKVYAESGKLYFTAVQFLLRSNIQNRLWLTLKAADRHGDRSGARNTGLQRRWSFDVARNPLHSERNQAREKDQRAIVLAAIRQFEASIGRTIQGDVGCEAMQRWRDKLVEARHSSLTTQNWYEGIPKNGR